VAPRALDRELAGSRPHPYRRCGARAEHSAGAAGIPPPAGARRNLRPQLLGLSQWSDRYSYLDKALKQGCTFVVDRLGDGRGGRPPGALDTFENGSEAMHRMISM
jgi:hypothetical protein